MSDQSQAVPNGNAADPPSPNNGDAKGRPRPEPQFQLPTDRVAFDKQMDFLLAYAAASDQGRKAVSNEDVALLVKMKASTVSLANAFFVKMGFLSKSGREYLPAKEVLDMKLANEWDATNAPQKLAPIIERSWFAQALRAKLDLRAVDESEAISDLAQKAGAGPEYKNQIKTLIDYMEISGIIRRDGMQIVLVRRRPVDNRAGDEVPVDNKTQTQATGSANESHSGQTGSVHFSCEINIDLAQMATWEPSRITAFFTGLAGAIAAQKGANR